jgi:N-acetylglucosaminyldiphosphoundecaprenol N-acetyl-beta-D-mannosaminyltransferase
MLIEAKKSIEFNNVLNNADITTPDGMPVAKTLSLKHKINQERVSGMDLFPALIRECSNRDKSIFLYGSTDNVLASIVNKAKDTYPKLDIQYYSPPFRFLSHKEKEDVIININRFNPDFLFVALGCPKQEKWMAEHKGIINSCMIGFGGAFAVYAGHQKRAPKWMYENSLEWLYRLLLEPKRLFRRYFVTNSLFIWYLCKEFRKK